MTKKKLGGLDGQMDIFSSGLVDDAPGKGGYRAGAGRKKKRRTDIVRLDAELIPYCKTLNSRFREMNDSERAVVFEVMEMMCQQDSEGR